MSRGELKSELSDVLVSARIHDADGSEHLICWTTADHNAAIEAGWYVDHGDGALQADFDQNKFQDARQVFDHLASLGTQGDERAIRAILLDLRSSTEAWLTELDGTRG